MNQIVLPFLSICCVTYNHEKFIRPCLEGFVMQKTNFPFEIIVHEDASTDNTANIVKEYETKYPNLFRCVYQTENQFAKQNTLINILFPMSKGKYIALCEGDDYWTDPYKLQKQIDFLETHPDFSICSTNAIVKNEIYNVETEWLGSKQKEVLTLKDLLRYGSGGATCTLVFRQSVTVTIPDWFYNSKGGDWLLQIIAAKQGKMKYFREVTGVYRRHEKGISCNPDLLKTIGIFENFGLNTINLLKENFNHKYDLLLNAHAAEYWHFNLMQFYIQANEKVKARKSALFVIRNILQIKEPFIKLKMALKIVISSYK